MKINWGDKMEIDWQNNIFDYQNESPQGVLDRMNTKAISGHGFTIKMSVDNFDYIKGELTNAKIMKGLPALDCVIDALVLHINKDEKPLNEDVIKI